MTQRFIITILAFLIGMGAHAFPAGATGCTADAACLPIDGTVYSRGHNGHCTCGLWAEVPGPSCRLENLFESLWRAFATPASKYPQLSVLGLATPRPAQVTGFSARRFPLGLHKSDSPLSYPIYLRTMTLLC